MVTAVENKDDRLAVGGPTFCVVVSLIQGEIYRVANASPIGLKISHVGSAVAVLLLKCEPLAIRSYARASHAKSSPVCDPFRPLNRFAYVRVKPHRPVVAVGTESLGFFDRIDQPSIGQPGNITVCLPHFGGCKHRDGRSPVQVVAQDGIAARIGPDEKASLPIRRPEERGHRTVLISIKDLARLLSIRRHQPNLPLPEPALICSKGDPRAIRENRLGDGILAKLTWRSAEHRDHPNAGGM